MVLEDGPEALKSVKNRIHELQKQEPPILHVLNTICHNEVIVSMGLDASSLLELRWYQRLFSNFTDIKAHSWKNKKEPDWK